MAGYLRGSGRSDVPGNHRRGYEALTAEMRIRFRKKVSVNDVLRVRVGWSASREENRDGGQPHLRGRSRKGARLGDVPGDNELLGLNQVSAAFNGWVRVIAIAFGSCSGPSRPEILRESLHDGRSRMS